MLLPLFLLAAQLGTAPPCPADRCKCIPPPPPREAIAQSDAVFTGVVARVEERRRSGKDAEWAVLEVTLAVTRRWKGPAADTLVVRTATDSAACGVEFVAGEEYLVYADGKGTLATDSCSRTAPVSRAGEDVEALGPPAGGG